MRIIAGTARGRKFDAPEGLDTRPTLDRVKEAMFGMIQFDLPGSDVLDLFSGSGNLGLEAASRGAGRVVCNDASPKCAALIRKNADALKLGGVVTVMQLDYAACIDRLSKLGQGFDFAFLDAPYRAGTGPLAAELLLAAGLIRPGGRIFLEHNTDLPPVIDPVFGQIRQTRRYGACSFSVIERGQA